MSTPFDLEDFIKEHLPDATGPTSWKGGQKWILPVCPWNKEHTNRSVFVAKLKSGAISARCLHDGCADKTWKDLRKLYDPDYQGGSRQSDDEEPWGEPLSLESPDLPAFPIDVLPKWIQDMAMATAESYQVPPCLPAALILAVLATALQGKFQVHVYGDWREQLALWVLAAGESGSGRSPVLNELMAPVYTYESELANTTERERVEIKAQNDVRSLRIKVLQKKAAKEEREEERVLLTCEIATLEKEQKPVPGRPRIIADDATPEVIARIMAANGGKVSIFSDEGAPIRIILGRYSNEPANVENLLKAYSGGTLCVDRVRDDLHIKVPRAQLTFGLSPQIVLLQELHRSTVLREVGFLARWLFWLPPNMVGTRNVTNPRCIPAEVREEYVQRVGVLLAIETELDQSGCVKRTEVQFSEGAVQKMKAWREKMEPRLGKRGSGRDLVDWLSKLHGQVARLAAILHLADQYGRVGWNVISADAVERAIRLAVVLERHAWAAYFGQQESDRLVLDAQRLVSKIKERNLRSFTRRDLHVQVKNARLRLSEDLQPALTLLVRHDYIRALDAPVGPKGGRPMKHAYQVNPQVFVPE